MCIEQVTTRISYYTCSAYTKVPCGTLCPSAHRIKTEAVLNLIQSTLQDIKKSLDEDNEAFLHSIQNEMEESEKMEKKRKEQGSQIVKKGFRNWNA